MRSFVKGCWRSTWPDPGSLAQCAGVNQIHPPTPTPKKQSTSKEGEIRRPSSRENLPENLIWKIECRWSWTKRGCSNPRHRVESWEWPREHIWGPAEPSREVRWRVDTSGNFRRECPFGDTTHPPPRVSSFYQVPNPSVHETSPSLSEVDIISPFQLYNHWQGAIT